MGISDVEEFYQQCDPGKKGLCLYGFPSEKWEVNLRAQKVPSELPEPARGINFARDGTPEDGWLSLVALHSDLWLLSVAFCFGSRLLFDKADRNRLFNMINDLPTIVEVVSGPSNDFKGSLAGIIKALTTDVEDFYRQCDPENERLCLYGFPTEVWKVKLPARDLPAELPEPTAGILFARDVMQEKDWLSLVAVHSDVWLLSVAFFFGDRFFFDKQARKCLFNMVNDLPRVFEVVTGAAKKQTEDKYNNNKSKSNVMQWAVNFPAEKLPPELPEPTMGINFARDGMREKNWLSLVALHSDLWLLSVAFYFAARLLFDKAERKCLFNMMNDLPTITDTMDDFL
ncbi:hypothetical protein GQ457_02G041470 [Hibiscus cannabinus]